MNSTERRHLYNALIDHIETIDKLFNRNTGIILEKNFPVARKRMRALKEQLKEGIKKYRGNDDVHAALTQTYCCLESRWNSRPDSKWSYELYSAKSELQWHINHQKPD